MTGLLLLLTMIAVTWLALWSREEDGQGWSPFDMREHEKSFPQPAPPSRKGKAAAASRERPWKRSGF